METIRLASFLPPSAPFTSLQPTTIPLPTPKDHEILIRVTHVSIQQVDLLYARGQHQNNNPRKGHIHPPFTLGLDFSGIVISTPSSRSSSTTTSNPKSPQTKPPIISNLHHSPSFSPGDRIFGSHPSAFSTFLSLPPAALHHIPHTISPRVAAALVSGVVSYTAARVLSQITATHTVLVTGVPGNLALIAAQIASSLGAKVICLARSEERAEAVRDISPGVTVLSGEGDWVGRIKAVTGGRGVDVILDHVGVVREGLGCLAFGGTVVLVGFAGRAGEMEEVGMNRILLNGARVVGYRFGEGGRRGMFDVQECWRGYLGMVERGEVRAIVDGRRYVGFKDVGRAMEDLDKGRLVGKAVVEVGGGVDAKL
ncbi:Quinone oxidoreductase-like protein 2 [Elsinoe australis]|uniref:Quinone oxidoreductase-like protein 2 n=1 Tax=Elsinoe australis TaxID=40998 RepID=A0A2P7YDX0_9PEZI|nr:Quinone oxidoreductase-like protein 2 [Elsinoe australis]